MKTEIIKEKKVFKPIEVKLKFETVQELESVIEDFDWAKDENISFNEFRELLKILKAELKNFKE